MRMDLSALQKEGKIRKISPDITQAKECLAVARRDIKVAKSLLETDSDWAFAAAYNAMLQSARAMMFSDGYSPIGENQHKTAVDYADVKLGAKYREKIELFDDMRKKRHKLIYEKAGAISGFEARHAVETAEEFIKKVEMKIKGN
jgi:uncharacterized protein (UPF0332 family)